MSYRKAEQLLALATLVAGRHVGVTLDDVIERFAVSKRAAQRMLRALETVFSDTAAAVDISAGTELRTLASTTSA